jgi:hypothetical protein
MITWRIVHFLFTPLPPKDERTCRKALPSVFQEVLAFRTLVNKINASCENNPDEQFPASLLKIPRVLPAVHAKTLHLLPIPQDQHRQFLLLII